MPAVAQSDHAQAAHHVLLTPAEEVALAKRVALGDEGARRAMVEANLRLVVSVAKRFRGLGLDFDDLVQEGSIGLIRAVDGFDWRRGTRLSTYAIFWIRQAIMRALGETSQTIRVPSHVGDRQRALRRTSDEMEAAVGRRPTRDELADASGIPRDQVDAALDAARASVSLNQTLGSEDVELGELLADLEAVDPVESADAEERVETVRLALDSLRPREREVVERRFGLVGEPETRLEVGDELGISRERVRQLEGQALARLAREEPELAAVA